MYTLVLVLVLVGGTGAGQGVAATHVSGFQSKAQCTAAIPKAKKAFEGSLPQSLTGNIALMAQCLKVSGTSK